MKKIWISTGVVIGTLAAACGMYLASGTRASAMPAVVEDIQYPFEKSKGLIHISVKNVYMGIGMLTGERKRGDTWTTLTGTVNFEPASKNAQARLQVDRIRLIERTPEGKDGRVFEPFRVFDADMTKGGQPEIQFPETRGKFPLVWENGANDCVYFVFEDFPLNVREADLVVTYNAKFPDQKHLAYFEDRLTVTRRTYPRSRS